MDEQQLISHLPWSATRREFTVAAREAGPDAACCVFVIADEIPLGARPGYSQLVIAYSRQSEPVTIAALLIRDGGVLAARVAAERILEQMRRLALETTLRAGVAPLGDDVEAAVRAATAAAVAGPAGEVSFAA
jgi:hypothetical protein